MTQQSGETSTLTMSVPSVPLVGAKLRKTLAGRLQEHVSAPTSSFARKQLEKMGWQEGTGLGKKRDGIVSHIKVQKRTEQAGLGTERLPAQERQTAESWWKDSLGETLAKLASKKSGKKKRKHKKEFTDEELFEATGGIRFGTKGGKLRQAKWRRAETGSSLEENAPEDTPTDGLDAIDTAKLFKEETLNKESGDSSSEGEKKSKKRKKSKNEGKKEKRKNKKAKRSKKE